MRWVPTAHAKLVATFNAVPLTESAGECMLSSLGRILKGAFVRSALQLLSVTLQIQRWNAEMYRWSGLVISPEQGYDAGFAVPVLMS